MCQYDPRTNEFTDMPSLPNSSNEILVNAVVVCDKIYTFGEWHCACSIFCECRWNHADLIVGIFDISTQSWSCASAPPEPICEAAVCSVGQWVIITGGVKERQRFSEPKFQTKSFIFDTVSHQWIVSNIALSLPRVYHRCVQVKSQFISIGGVNRTYGIFFSMEGIQIKHLLRWEVIKHFILLRHLVDHKRANPIQIIKRSKCDPKFKLNPDEVIHALFTEISLDVFRNVLSYLIWH